MKTGVPNDQVNVALDVLIAICGLSMLALVWPKICIWVRGNRDKIMLTSGLIVLGLIGWTVWKDARLTPWRPGKWVLWGVWGVLNVVNSIEQCRKEPKPDSWPFLLGTVAVAAVLHFLIWPEHPDPNLWMGENFEQP